MDNEQFENLTSLVDLASGSGAQKLSSWENDFIASMAERLTEYGMDTFMSDKQWAVIDRIEKKLGIE